MTRPPPRPTLFPYTTLFRSLNRPPSQQRTPPLPPPWRPRAAAGGRPCGAATRARAAATYASTSCAASLSRSEEHTSELQSRLHLVCRLLLEKKKTTSQTL